MRSFLIALLALLWLILLWLYYKDYQKCCSPKEIVPDASLSVAKSTSILFNLGNGAPVLGDGWPGMRDSLAALTTDSTALEITGYFCNNSQPEENEEIAKARAAEVRKLFPDVLEERIILLSKGQDCDTSHRTALFESVDFSIRVRTENIKEIDDRTLIYFPSNSTQKLNSDEVEAYLNDVANRVTKKGESIVITGHTDGLGDADKNLALGQKRAEIVKQYLVSKGVDAAKITSTSKGEEQPIANNDSADGRSKNRRTELQIIK
jgi:OOP family OmpA-OmpF porin